MNERRVRTSDGIQLLAHRHGEEGVPVALCHGGPGMWDYLAPLAESLSDAASVWRYDQRGCGRSDGRMGPFTLERFIQDLDELRTAAGVERWVAGGHSWGATLALLYALAHPTRVAGVLYISGVGLEWPRWKPTFHREHRRRLASDPRAAELAAMQDRSSDEERELRIFGFMSDFADPAFGRLLATELADAPSNMECNRQLNDELEAIDPAEWARRCAKLSVPVLVVEGMHDPRPVAAADSLVASLPNVRRETFTGSAHWPWLEEPARFQSVVRDWLRRLDLPPA